MDLDKTEVNGTLNRSKRASVEPLEGEEAGCELRSMDTAPC
jgi:hypothetical protein